MDVAGSLSRACQMFRVALPRYQLAFCFAGDSSATLSTVQGSILCKQAKSAADLLPFLGRRGQIS